MGEKTIYTIGRQFGSGGRAIGRRLAEHLHILRIVFQTGDPRRYLLCRCTEGGQQDRHQRQNPPLTHYFHHFRKNNCTNPKISKRPSSINNVLENFTTTGNPA